ncbi:unnamed protein product [Rhizoctonia solani]|uniref:Uncharacterized protein n=1 Tax=Rhizoctonia solani TaxID=456999 RepID=A0A8H3E8N1_9AGAM|nr:unnamed protein product [Rhizoctonia solani]
MTNPIRSFNYLATLAMLPSEPTVAMLNFSILAQLLGITVVTWFAQSGATHGKDGARPFIFFVSHCYSRFSALSSAC